jgi:hypothetical protein
MRLSITYENQDLLKLIRAISYIFLEKKKLHNAEEIDLKRPFQIENCFKIERHRGSSKEVYTFVHNGSGLDVMR